MPWRRLLQATLFVLVFGIGLLLGGEHCAPPDEAEEPPPCPLLVCPPCPSEPKEEEEDPGRPRRVSEPSASLPPAPGPDARHREQLLAWVRERSSELRRCGESEAVATRLVVTLWLDQSGGVEKVEIGHEPGALGKETAACLRAGMREWRPPPELVEERDRLVFGMVM